VSMPQGIITESNIVRGNMTPPRGARIAGLHRNGFPIYEETVPVTTRREKRDSDGNIVYVIGPDGSRRRPQMERYVVGEETRQFIIEDAGNGMTRKNYHFAPSAEELAGAHERAEAAAAQADLLELAKAARDEGVRLPDLVRSIRAALADDDGEAQQTEGQKRMAKARAAQQQRSG
jgi:hypothetical protein